MNYRSMITESGLFFWFNQADRKGNAGTLRASAQSNPRDVHAVISQLRAHAFYPGSDKRPVAEACRRARVSPRVVKRWAMRLLVEALPRAARLTGPQLR